MKHLFLYAGWVLYVLWALLPECSALDSASDPIHPAAIGWSLSSTREFDWERADGQGTLILDEGTLVLNVPPNTTACWRIVTEPIWIQTFTHLHIQAQASGLTNDASHPLIELYSGRIGPRTPSRERDSEQDHQSYSIHWSRIQNSHEKFVQDIHASLQGELIDQIVITLQTKDEPAQITFSEFSFRNPKAGEQTLLSCAYIKNISLTKILEKNKYLPFPETGVSLQELDIAADPVIDAIICADVPFQVNPPDSIIASRMAERSGMTFPIGKSCSEIYLLMGAYCVGSDEPFRYVPRDQIHEPDQLIVTKKYTDESTEKSFPFNLNHNRYIVSATSFCSYLIPVDPNKTLDTIVVEERMSYGQIFLAGITVNTEKNRFTIPQKTYIRSVESVAPPEKPSAPKITVESNQRFIIENDFYMFVLERGYVITEMVHKQVERNILQQPIPILRLLVNGIPMPEEHWRMDSFTIEGRRIDIQLSSIEEAYTLNATLTLIPDSSPSLGTQLQLQQQGYTPLTIRLRYPDLRGLQIDTSGEDYYLFPSLNSVWDNRPTQRRGEYRSEFPLQFMDVYSLEDSCGIALHTRDRNALPKDYFLHKDESSSMLSIVYGAQQAITLLRDQRFQAPDTMIEFHSGDWHAPLESYKKWRKEWPRQGKSRAPLPEIYFVRRDYPQTGTDILFDADTQRYRFSPFIFNSQQTVGGVDLIEIYDWERQPHSTLSLGESGIQPHIAAEVQSAQDRGVATSLCFDGYLVDSLSPFAVEQGRDWQLVDSGGNRKVWPGGQKIYLCPFVRGWQEHLSTAIFDTVQKSGVQAILLERFGFAGPQLRCYAETHEHPPGAPPLLGEYEMLRAIREKLDTLDSPVSLYLDQVPNDWLSQFIDTAYDDHYVYSEPFNPGGLNLFRYAVPQCKTIAILQPGDSPRAISPHRAKLAFFHGQGVWLKGHTRSWISRETREWLQKVYPFYHKYSSVFDSEHADPLIPTLQEGLYANRFSEGNTEHLTETLTESFTEIITFYNESPHTLQGEFIRLPYTKANIKNEFSLQRFETKLSNNALTVYGQIEPQEVNCIVIEIQPSELGRSENTNQQ